MLFPFLISDTCAHDLGCIEEDMTLLVSLKSGVQDLSFSKRPALQQIKVVSIPLAINSPF